VPVVENVVGLQAVSPHSDPPGSADARTDRGRSPRPGFSKKVPFYFVALPRVYLSRAWRFLHAFDNPVATIARLAATRPPWELVWADGTSHSAHSWSEVQELGREAIFWNRTFTWKSPETGRKIRLRGLDYPTISSREYRWLPVAGRVVLDIGANIGDTAVYFVASGAERVIALEPYPYSCQLAEENVRFSGTAGQIRIVNGGVGRTGSIRIDPKFKNTVGSDLHGTEGGIEVPIFSLSDLIRTFGLKDTVLKMDCEGSEYTTILEAATEDLRCFSHMQIEYHYGAATLRTRLSDAGFKVRVTGPRYSVVPEAVGNPIMMSGYIFAERI
jgi:FkbM family methyltransferase